MVPVPRGAVAIQSDPSWLAKWSAALLDAALTPPEDLAAHRLAMVSTARARFDWRTVVEAWDTEFLRARERDEPSLGRPPSSRRATTNHAEADAKRARHGPGASSQRPRRPRCADDHDSPLLYSFGDARSLSGTSLPPASSHRMESPASAPLPSPLPRGHTKPQTSLPLPPSPPSNPKPPSN